jgi:hypothetical protein
MTMTSICTGVDIYTSIVLWFLPQHSVEYTCKQQSKCRIIWLGGNEEIRDLSPMASFPRAFPWHCFGQVPLTSLPSVLSIWSLLLNWMTLCEKQVTIDMMWFWMTLCEKQVTIVMMWFWMTLCEKQVTIVMVWFWMTLCEKQVTIDMMWFWMTLCEKQVTIVMMWFCITSTMWSKSFYKLGGSSPECWLAESCGVSDRIPWVWQDIYSLLLWLHW